MRLHRIKIMAAAFWCTVALSAAAQGDAVTSIQATHVQAAFEKTGLRGQHARLFFNREDIDRIKELHRQGDTLVRIGVRELLKEANEVLRQPVLTYQLDEAKLRIPSIHRFAVQVPSLVMAYQLTGDTVYAARVWKQLEQMILYPDWGTGRHFLDAGIAGFDVALSYDGLYDYLSADRKEKLKEATKRLLLAPAREQISKRAWWHVAHHNWNGISNGGVIMAALALFEDDPEEMSKIVANAANGLPYYIKSFEPDGQSEEGLMYWSYGLMYTTIAFESMHRVLGTAFDLDAFPGFKKTGWFPLYVSGPVTSLSVGDDPVKNSRSRSFFWFAKRNNDSALARLQYDLCLENNNVTWTDLVYYNPAMIGQVDITASKSPDTYVRGIEVMALRENWKKDGWFLSMHGGHNNANHGHLDAGTFDLQGDGEVWAYGDLGRDDYTYPGYFSKVTVPGYLDAPVAQSVPGRWHFYRLRAEGKNCIVFNPSTAPDQDEQGAAQLVAQGSTPSSGFYVLDLKQCYHRDVTDYHRGILMDRKLGVMTVQDDIKAKESADIWWSMHTRAAIRISKDGREAELKQGGKTLVARIVAPAKGTFAVLPATYLPGEAFPLTKNTPNNGFSKLVIHLPGTRETSIRVDFSGEENPLPKVKKIMPLLQWKE